MGGVEGERLDFAPMLTLPLFAFWNRWLLVSLTGLRRFDRLLAAGGSPPAKAQFLPFG